LKKNINLRLKYILNLSGIKNYPLFDHYVSTGLYGCEAMTWRSNSKEGGDLLYTFCRICWLWS